MRKNPLKSLFSFAMLMLFTSVTHGQPGSPLFKVIVSPDHKDWTYKVNEEAKFTVQVFRNGNLVDNAVIDYEMGPEMLPDIKKEE